MNLFFCGDGRTRTAVQTPLQAAFYTLILPLAVGPSTPEGGLGATLSPGSWRSLRESLRASGLNDTPWSEHDRREVRGILVGGAALAPRIKLTD